MLAGHFKQSEVRGVGGLGVGGWGGGLSLDIKRVNVRATTMSRAHIDILELKILS
jgi:hypothetical protein